MYSFIEKCVKESFQRTKLSPSTLSTLSQNIYFIAKGFRASLLIDYYLNEKQAKALVDNLRQKKECQELLLLQFTDRFTFIGHRSRLKEHYKSFEGIYVDIQGENPILLETIPEDVQQFIKTKLGPFLFNDDKENILLISTLPSFMVSVTGWLLEYPIIYVCHHLNEEIIDEWEPKKNCLGNRPLVWIRLDIKEKNQHGHSLLRFTYPVCILPTQHDQQQLFEQLKMKYTSRLLSSSSPAYQLNIIQEIISLDRVAI
ncbi:hypothetical protein BJ944DRAFT_260644 [Cunninghamella echinulata]|nr:hypothetical protein BJ944DRAFT_260644 [Cunninghamella echinulata]